MLLKPGDAAPDFTAKDQDGKKVTLKKFSGKKVVLYFYPKDDTSTCTVQACNLRDNYALLKKKKLVVLGVSVDPVEKHLKFQQKHDLPFTLVADPDQTIVNAYGVWGTKKLYGREYMGTHRTTFLINEQGIIEHIIEKVTSKTHSEQILKVWGMKD